MKSSLLPFRESAEQCQPITGSWYYFPFPLSSVHLYNKGLSTQQQKQSGQCFHSPSHQERDLCLKDFFSTFNLILLK